MFKICINIKVAQGCIGGTRGNVTSTMSHLRWDMVYATLPRLDPTLECHCIMRLKLCNISSSHPIYWQIWPTNAIMLAVLAAADKAINSTWHVDFATTAFRLDDHTNGTN